MKKNGVKESVPVVDVDDKGQFLDRKAAVMWQHQHGDVGENDMIRC